MIAVTPSDIGRWVRYQLTNEIGRIKSYNEKFVFVVYKCDNNWDNYRDYTACATKRDDLKYMEIDYDYSRCNDAHKTVSCKDGFSQE